MTHTNRRTVLGSATSLIALGSWSNVAAALLPTPRQTAGPFYPPDLPLDADNDLVQVAGRAERAAGTILHLGGRVLDANGRPVRGVRVEIWQCDAFGHYHHPRDRGGDADPDFQGFGHFVAADDGAYRFRTIEPVPYPGRTPHIHFQILGPGIEPMTTQMYLADHPLNAGDFLYQQLGDARALVTVGLEPAPDLEPNAKRGAKRAQFDIVLGTGAVQRDS